MSASMRSPSNKGIKKLLFLGASVLIFTLYLIYSYNNIKGRSYIHEPVYISLEGSIPDNTRLELVYQTYNDPTTTYKAKLVEQDSVPADTYVFKIDSSYRISNFAIYFRSLESGVELTISNIVASGENGTKFPFSLRSDDLIVSKNLLVEQAGKGTISIKKIPFEKSIGSSIYFYTRSSIPGVIVRTNLRYPEIPSLLALLAILILGTCMVYSLYPVISKLNWKGLPAGAYLLALAILIMPSGEQISNLLLALAIAAGFIKGSRDKILRHWISENRGFLLFILVLISIYLLAFLFSWKDTSTLKLLKIRYGLPMTLLAVALNTNSKQEIRIQYAALLSGVIISIFMHFGWAIIFTDAVELKSKLFSYPHYYLESAVFSRIHHSYLSVLYLATLGTIFLKKDIIVLRRGDVIVFSLLIITGLLFAFSRAAILSLLLVLVFLALKKIFSLFKLEITRIARFVVASALTIGILILVFVDLQVDPTASANPVKGLSTRAELWKDASELIKQKPIFGWGPGKFEDALEESSGDSSFNNNRWRVLNTHNQFLETTGMFGLIVGIGLAWFLLFPTGFTRQDPRFSDFITIAAIIFATGFFFESLLNRNLGILIFGLCYGLLIKMKTIYDS